MYERYWGLQESPFRVNPDPRYLFRTRGIEEALAGLTFGVQSRKGFILLTGEVGTGKTTLLNALLNWLRERQMRTAFVFNTKLTVRQLFDFLMAEFEIPCESCLKSQMLMRLNNWLLERYRAGETAVLVIDEAQNLSPEVLEEIRLLTNLETSTDKLLQIVLSGQPELEVKLRRPALRQLRQRITIRCKTNPLTLDETRGYIAERLRIAGANGEPIFSPEAIESVHHYSRGIPRIINLLCEYLLMNAFVEQQKPASAALVAEIAREFELNGDPSPAESESFPTEPSPEGVQALLSDLAQALERFREQGAPVADFGEGKP